MIGLCKIFLFFYYKQKQFDLLIISDNSLKLPVLLDLPVADQS